VVEEYDVWNMLQWCSLVDIWRRLILSWSQRHKYMVGWDPRLLTIGPTMTAGAGWWRRGAVLRTGAGTW
jgi:hypothetical protein